jgi:putative glycerol-1-phosphate prenyltransferase/phosphoglycerol geranylgeranyltransferase
LGEREENEKVGFGPPSLHFFVAWRKQILYLYGILHNRRKKRNCMKPGKTELRLNAEIEKRGALFAVLLDPDTSDEAAFVKAGAMAAENGADLLLVGGSYLGNFTLPKQVAALKANVDLPVVLFPGGASQVVPGFDAMLFMTLVSGRNPNYLIDEQVRGGALVRALNMEAIPTAYQLINSGKRTTVEYISGTMPVPANKPKLSMVNSIAAELMGMRYVYLEAGSGAEEPVPVEHIAYTRKATEMTIITGGGIKDPQTAAVRVAAGANIIVTGTLWEKVEDPALLKEFAAAIHVKG